jgi:uncharacterized membrane protein YpjA
MIPYIYSILKNRLFLMLLLIINVLGTIYGYYWYKYQLVETPMKFILFVPDSPTASLFFVFVLIAFLYGKNMPLFEALAIVTLFKYGIWAVAMNLAGGAVLGGLDIISFMLIFSHLGMAIEGLLYAPFYRFKIGHLAFAAVIVLHNEIIDYVFGHMPQYDILDPYRPTIAYLTFWLSVVSILIAYFLVIKRKNKQSIL